MEDKKDVLIRGEKYDIHFGADLSDKIGEVIGAPDTFLITDSTVEKLYGHKYMVPRYVLPAGEESKKLSNIGRICETMLEAGCNRKTTVAALGGGVVGDAGGFAASVYMRGVNVVQIPTTLLAMADSSIGGKTGVNLGAKNIVGTFHQPSAVITSLGFLKTLPNREILCGMGEIFKTALLDKNIYAGFKSLMANVKSNKNIMAALDPEKLYSTLKMCISFKLDIVTRDEKESSLRKILNVGHTLGHALEAYDNYRLTHGEYVAHGIALEAAAARDIGLIESGHYDEIVYYSGILTGGGHIRFDAEKLAGLAGHDKKNQAGAISIILSYAPGKTEEVMLKKDELAKTFLRIKGRETS